LTELVLLRFIHLDKFYPLKYPQIVLEIANNITQNQHLLLKQQTRDDSPSVLTTEGDQAGVLLLKKVEFKQ